ncbi:hypothetical protein L6164_003152 [Bauhinia variegata]|uniref:Uncharacterized protein n=1 Tax=Bauhinia variegata TaxID=167791 RepID=A0ACB9Q0G3_BAUVA|nr:hypothetical protein L6164_003152 [Bauhinia variegata]
MEFVSIVVDKILEHTLIPVTRQVNYVIFYKGNVEELKKQAKRLLRERESLQHRVDVAQRNGEEIEGMVNDWLCEVKENASKAKILLDEDDKRHKRSAEEIEGHDLKWPSDIASKAEELLDEDDKYSKTAWCSSKSFSSMCWRHQISRKAKKLAQEIANIKGEREFTQVSYRGELNITETWSSSAKNDEAFDSRVAALNQIMEAITDTNLRLIGVHGLGGVGKSTLVREVAIKVKEKSPDTTVVFVDVKQNPKIEKIQQDIADMLELKLKQQSLVVRATLLRERFEKDKKKNILVILDDLWEKLDLNKIGIIFDKENKNYKILMTSRKRDVLSKMDTQKNFWLGELSKEESWELFQVKVALNESSKGEEFLTIAREVVGKCGGLPVAIVTIAAALKGKEEIAEWRDVLQRLQNHNYDEINGSIVVSYENLKEDCLRSIFLLAGVINSSAIIDLFKYCYGLDLFYGIDNLDARISELKDSCLLQNNDPSMSHFSMHDVVRDTAISIASKDEQFFVKKIGKADEDEWVTNDKLKSCRKMLLDFSDIGELPEGLQCSNLTFFYLRSKDSSLKLPHNFFKGMPKLKVIVLINMTFEFLPSSISLLGNLHTLCLEECVLENIEGIGELKGLKILSLSGSKFTNLPLEIGKLTKLRLLDLNRCVQLESIPPGVLLNLQMLEVLLMGSSFSKWAVGDQQSTASLAEIKDLRKLNTLAIDVPDQNMLPKEQLFESLHLQRYEVCIGDPWRRFVESITSRFLTVDLHTGLDTKHYFKSLLDHVGDLHVEGLADLKNVVPNINEKGLIELKHLVVNGNFELQFIADLVDHKDVIFPKLESLDARNSPNLVKICNGSITERSFSKLKVVKVVFCVRMKSLFSLSLPTCLPHLNEIQVKMCRVLEGIVSDAGNVAGPFQFEELRTLTLTHVPSLIGFYFEDKTSSKVQQKKTQVGDDNILDPLVVLFSHKVFIPNLETLNIRRVNKLNKLWDQKFDGISFRNLKTLNITKCDGISKLLPFNVLENLEELEVSSCNSLEVIFDLEGTRKEETHGVVKSSHLRKLNLDGLPKLKHVWNKDPKKILGFQFLSTIEASECDSLKYLFPASVAKALAKLHFLSIRSCCELETIVGREEEGADVPINFVFARVTELHFQRLPKLMSFYPGTYSTEWPLLQKLYCKFVGRSWNIFGSGLLGFEEFHCQNGLEVSTQLSPAIQKSIPMLRELKLYCNKNMMVWIQRYSPYFYLSELQILKLRFFHDVPLWSFIQSMYVLETLHVKYGLLEEIFSHEREVIDKTQHSSEIHIKTLTLDRLPKLKHVCREGDEPNLILQRLENLYVRKCSGLSNLVPSSIKFNHLASIKVFNCNGILHLISSSTARSLSRLTTMEITECKMIKEIVADEVADDKITCEIKFSELKTLTLDNLPRLESFCSMNSVFHFPALENVLIVGCPKLKFFSKQAPNTTNLQSVKDSCRSDAKSYWEDDLNSTVQKLYIDKLYYELEDLNLSEYPEPKHIWHTQLPDGAFCKLRTLIFSNYKWSSKVLQWNVLKCLVNLKELKVEFCKSIEVVFDLEGAKDEERDYVLAMEFFSTLTLTSLPNLKHIWNKDPQGILDFPGLTRLKLVDVPKLDHSLVEKVIPNLELERLVVDKAIVAWFGQFLTDRFNSLEVLGLQFSNDVNTGFPYSVLQKMTNLKTLMVKDCLLEEIFPFKKQVVEGNHSGAIQLKGLCVENLQKLRHICEEGYELDPSLKNLKRLCIKECCHLLNLGASSLTFNLLKILIVKNCEQLSYLMTPSTAKSLGKLKRLIIEDCSMIKEIISGKVVDAETDEIRFNILEVLMLKNLPCLESFCSMNYAFNFPSLEGLVIWQCPNLKKFSNGVSSMPNLERLVGDLFEFDLNSTGEKTYNYEIVSEDDLPDMDDLWDQDSESDNEHLNESDQYEVEEEDKVEEHKEHEEKEEENINGCITEQSTISYPESRDIDLQASTNEDITLSTPLLALSHEHQTSGKRGSQKKIEDMIVIEQSTTSYSENMEAHKKQKQGFEISISNFDSETRLQEQHINGETTNIDDDKGLQLKILTETTSSLDSIIEKYEGIKMNTIEQSTTSCGKTKDTDLLTSTNDGINMSTPLAATSQEYQTSGVGNQKVFEDINVIEQSTASSESREAQKTKTQGINISITNFDFTSKDMHNAIEVTNNVSIVSASKELQGIDWSSPMSQSSSPIANVAERPLEHAQVESFDLQKETSEVDQMVQIQLALENTENGDHANFPNVDPPVDSLPLHSSEAMLPSSGGNEDYSSDGDTKSKNEQLNESDRNHQFEVMEEDKESGGEEEHKVHKEVKAEENMNIYVIEQSITGCPESKGTNLQASRDEDFKLSAPLSATSQEYQTSEEGGNQKKIESMNAVEQSTASYLEVGQNVTELINNSVCTVSTSKEMQDVAQSSSIPKSFSSTANGAELSLGHAQVESFDLQNETSEVDQMVQDQLALENIDNGDNANIPNVDPPVDSLPLRSSEAMPTSSSEFHAQSRIKDTDVEASRAAITDTGDVPHQNKESTPRGQNEKHDAIHEGKEGTVHEGVPLGNSTEGVASCQEILDIDVGTVASPLPRLRRYYIAFCFSFLALLGCYFLLAYWGPGIPLVSNSSPSSPVKDAIDLNKDQISLLRDAFARYPNLGGPQKDFSPRFHDWAYKTLADLLHFLKTENPVTMAEEREKEFHVLCNEAIQLGFDKTWVEEMRKRVVKDPEVDYAQKRLMKILDKEQELKQEKEMLNEFIQERRKKCFDFL